MPSTGADERQRSRRVVEKRRRDRRSPAKPPNEGDSQPHWLKRIGLAILSTLVSINLWTGGPLFALWVGSRVQSAEGQLSMAAVGATVGVLIVVTMLLYRLLAVISFHYDEVIARRTRRRQAPWLKPMSGERRSLEVKRPLTAVERLMVLWVVVALLGMEVWFFFFAHYSLPG